MQIKLIVLFFSIMRPESHEAHGVRDWRQSLRWYSLKARFWLQRENPQCASAICESYNQKFTALSALRHFADVHTTDVYLIKLSVTFIQASRIVEFEVDDLATLNIDSDLARVGTRHQDTAFIRLPFCSLSIFTLTLNLNQRLGRHLDEYVFFKQPAV